MEKVAVVVVTYNRSELLSQCIDKVLAQTAKIDCFYIVDNASTDNTQEMIRNKNSSLIKTILSPTNLGGAGGFKLGVETAYNDGYDWIFIIDDDVFPHEKCLDELLKFEQGYARIAVRETKQHELFELAAIDYNLSNPFYLNPKRKSVAEAYVTRDNMPKAVNVHNVAFEGLLVHRKVIDVVGLPNADYFIFYDDTDYALRIREAGFDIYAVRDSILVRQLDYDRNSALDTWKGYYMYRNFFLIHFLYGKNVLVKNKPYVLTVGLYILSLFKKKDSEYRKNVLRALKDAKKYYLYRSFE